MKKSLFLSLSLAAVLAMGACKSSPAVDADLAKLDADWAVELQLADQLMENRPEFEKFAAAIKAKDWVAAAFAAPSLVAAVRDVGGPLLANTKLLFADVQQLVKDVIEAQKLSRTPTASRSAAEDALAAIQGASAALEQ